MKKKISTKHFGEKNLLELKPIQCTDELFVGEISVTSHGSRYRVKGLIDKNFREVIPFGDLHRMIGSRKVNDNIILIDCVSVSGNFDIGWNDEYGSVLLMRGPEGFNAAYNSNASIMYVTNDMLYGANYMASEEDAYDQQWVDTSYPIQSFEYNFQDNVMVRQEELGDISKADLQEYFYDRLLPYPSKMLCLRPVGNLNNKKVYELG